MATGLAVFLFVLLVIYGCFAAIFLGIAFTEFVFPRTDEHIRMKARWFWASVGLSLIWPLALAAIGIREGWLVRFGLPRLWRKTRWYKRSQLPLTREEMEGEMRQIARERRIA
jgi:hypothetical protein